uniref:Uncharacterized protein n=1 Tax=Alexandrium monilatum TaxID=311494 RepID=A0A7S4PVL7_9DINO
MQGPSAAYPPYAGSQLSAGMSGPGPAYYAGSQPSAGAGPAFSPASMRAANAAAQQAYASYTVPAPAGAGPCPGQSAPAASSAPMPAPGSTVPPFSGGTMPGADARTALAGGGIPYDPAAMPQADMQGIYSAQQQQQQQPPVNWGQGQEVHKARTRVRVKLPEPRCHGAPKFYGCVPKDSATFAWPELCVTPDNELNGMAPVPGVQKTWYNTVFYYPEQKSHLECQFLERFVPGPNGEWIDVVKARRMANFYDEKQREEIREQEIQQRLVSGSGMEETGYIDAYSGEPLVACRGELASQEAILQENGVHRSAKEMAKVMMRDVRRNSDWDNLRIFWPFARPSRNKMVSQHTYDWFDRNHNPYVPADDCVEIYELNSMYVDKEHYERDLAGQIMQRRQQAHAEAYQPGGTKFVQM